MDTTRDLGVTNAEFNYLKGYCKGAKLHNSVKAMSYILLNHKGQTRNDGQPYYVHPVKVAAHLVSLNLFEDDSFTLDTLLSSALLHDVLEDTPVTYNELCEEFNNDIAHVVNLLTKTEDLSNFDYYDRIRENLLASLVKIADRCHNVSSMAGVFCKPRLQRYVTETKEVVQPLIRHLRDNYPEVSNQVVVIGYHIKSVLSAIEVMIPIIPDNEKND